jgi:hypothetical protein
MAIGMFGNNASQYGNKLGQHNHVVDTRGAT